MTEHTIVIACECSRTTRDLEDTEEKIVMKGIGLTEKDIKVLQRPQIEIGPADTDERMNLAAPMRLTIDLPERNGGGGQPREADRHGASVLMLAIVTDIENAPDRCRDLTLHRQLDMGVGEEGLIIGTERTVGERVIAILMTIAHRGDTNIQGMKFPYRAHRLLSKRNPDMGRIHLRSWLGLYLPNKTVFMDLGQSALEAEAPTDPMQAILTPTSLTTTTRLWMFS